MQSCEIFFFNANFFMKKYVLVYRHPWNYVLSDYVNSQLRKKSQKLYSWTNLHTIDIYFTNKYIDRNHRSSIVYQLDKVIFLGT